MPRLSRPPSTALETGDDILPFCIRTWPEEFAVSPQNPLLFSRNLMVKGVAKLAEIVESCGPRREGAPTKLYLAQAIREAVQAPTSTNLYTVNVWALNVWHAFNPAATFEEWETGEEADVGALILAAVLVIHANTFNMNTWDSAEEKAAKLEKRVHLISAALNVTLQLEGLYRVQIEELREAYGT